MVTEEKPAINEEKLMGFVMKVVGDFGGFASVGTGLLGHRLGLYKAMADSKATTPDELASRTGTNARLVREWLVNQAAGGYVDYDPATERFTLPPEHAIALTDENSPACVAGGFIVLGAAFKSEQHIRESFRTGKGFTWGQHDDELFEGTEKFFRSSYIGALVSQWLPALDGVVAKLQRGAKVADVGCGHGASTIIMAKEYPNSTFVGFDDHAPSIEAARKAAAEAGVSDRVSFEVASAQAYPGSGYDLIAYFDCLHDMGDPIGAMKHAAETIAPDGVAMIVEPMAGEKVEENLNPVGLIYSAASVLVCTPNALATGNTHLGTIATEAQLRDVAAKGGLTKFRRATEGPFNRIFEAKL